MKSQLVHVKVTSSLILEAKFLFHSWIKRECEWIGFYDGKSKALFQFGGREDKIAPAFDCPADVETSF